MASPASASKPVVVKPVNVVEAPGITITEHFGHVSSKDGTCSLAISVVKGASEEAWQCPGFDEYVICNAGSVEFLQSDGTRTCIRAGDAVFLPKGLRVKWVWPEATTYTVLCLPGFSPELSGREEEESVTCAKDSESMNKLQALHHEAGTKVVLKSEETVASEGLLRPLVVQPVNVVEGPAITITECFGHVASKDGTFSLGVATVTKASDEAWQCPGFDEYVICNEGSIEFLHGDGTCTTISAGEGIFLPKGFRVKWVWPAPAKYTVLCLPAFAPHLSGREEEEGATCAKDSASMRKLEELHESSAPNAVGA